VVDTAQMIQRATPPAFRTEVTNLTVPMLPLVRDLNRQWQAGWCTYPDGFENNPDIEVFCGGENEKTGRAVACWRQGNLLHFGFQQTPAELNENGQRLLLNSIAYISRFTEDRPIAVTPSVFAGPVGYPRAYLDRRLGQAGDVAEATWLLAGRWVDHLKGRSAAEIREWYVAHRAYLHPGPDQKLDVDPDALALQAPIDQPAFFETIIRAMRSPDASLEPAKQLLARYGAEIVPKDSSADVFESWFQQNRDFLFFSDQGDYRWYIDPLAKKRGIPSRELRGPARATSGR